MAPQCLFLRLLQRRGPLFRVSGLTYADVGDARAAAAHLERLAVAHLMDASGDWEPFLQVRHEARVCAPSSGRICMLWCHSACGQ